MGGIRDKAEQANLFRRAMNGDKAALGRVIEMGLNRHREKVAGARGTIDRYHRTEWDAEGMRERVLDGEELDEEVVLDAFSRIHRKLLFLSAAFPAMLAGDREAAGEWEEEIRSQAYDLFIMLHNPAIRYRIVGGFRPALRDDVDDYLDRMSVTLWGTVQALVEEGEIEPEDFPPEVQPVMEHMAGYAEEQRQAGD